MKTKRVIVIGAGIGGLTTAAILARAGLDVTVLEAHIYPGGCAGTFFHKGYKFDAGATLAGGFYPGGPMSLVAEAAGISAWPGHHSEPAMVVHLRDGQQVTRWGDERRWLEREKHFGAIAEPFWQWQEGRADALWALALRAPAWPPQTEVEGFHLIGDGIRWLLQQPQQRLRPSLWLDAFGTVADHIPQQAATLQQFVDAQLLISAQTTSRYANALYGAAALDLPRRGIVHLKGGIGAIAETLVAAIRAHGGNVRYRQEVHEIIVKHGKPSGVRTKRGEQFDGDLIVGNLPPWNIAKLLQSTPSHQLPRTLRTLSPHPEDGWGAFMLYMGIDEHAIPDNFPLHHQIVIAEPMGEGNTLFLSLSPHWDNERAPAGQRVLTISTHTALGPWWQARQASEEAYEERKALYTEMLLIRLKERFSWLHESVIFTMAGTPTTFQHFTRRERGWVGGFPQTNLFRLWGPRLMPEVWMVGDSIFPGQSTAAVALGGIRVARSLLSEIGASKAVFGPESIMRTAQ